MKKIDINSMTNNELNAKLAELKSELFNLRFSLATGNLPNNSSIKNAKKEIARIKTLIRERELKATEARA